MQRGDVLTRVDGRAADDWTKRDLQALFRSQARPVEVELRRNGETVRVQLELAPLL